MKEQPTALRLAAELEACPTINYKAHAAELRRLYPHELANEVWQVKTQWVQDTAKPEELGMHRADVMRQRLEQAKAQRDALLEALKGMRHKYGEYACSVCDHADAAIQTVEEGRPCA